MVLGCYVLHAEQCITFMWFTVEERRDTMLWMPCCFSNLSDTMNATG